MESLSLLLCWLLRHHCGEGVTKSWKWMKEETTRTDHIRSMKILVVYKDLLILSPP